MEYLILPTVTLAIIVPYVLYQILSEIKKIKVVVSSSNAEIKELNATMKYLKRKYHESGEV